MKKGNPKNIRTFADLKREDVQIVNREAGSGARVLMDEKLRQNHILTAEVRGYHHIVNSHLEAAAAVSRGEADVALGTEKHSQQVAGIDFIFQQEDPTIWSFAKKILKRCLIRHFLPSSARRNIRRRSKPWEVMMYPGWGKSSTTD